jgi:hypothetical protein
MYEWCRAKQRGVAGRNRKLFLALLSHATRAQRIQCCVFAGHGSTVIAASTTSQARGQRPARLSPPPRHAGPPYGTVWARRRHGTDMERPRPENNVIAVNTALERTAGHELTAASAAANCLSELPCPCPFFGRCRSTAGCASPLKCCSARSFVLTRRLVDRLQAYCNSVLLLIYVAIKLVQIAGSLQTSSLLINLSSSFIHSHHH